MRVWHRLSLLLVLVLLLSPLQGVVNSAPVPSSTADLVNPQPLAQSNAPETTFQAASGEPLLKLPFDEAAPNMVLRQGPHYPLTDPPTPIRSGLDFGQNGGDGKFSVLAMFGGRVTFSGKQTGYTVHCTVGGISYDTNDYYVEVLDDATEWKVQYHHLSSFAVDVGTTVKQGDFLGNAGNQGCVTHNGAQDGVHLHAELFIHNKRVTWENRRFQTQGGSWTVALRTASTPGNDTAADPDKDTAFVGARASTNHAPKCTDDLRISKGLSSLYNPVTIGQQTTFRADIINTGTSSCTGYLALQDAVIFGKTPSITVAPGGSYAFTATKAYSQAGSVSAEIKWSTDQATWQLITPGANAYASLLLSVIKLNGTTGITFPGTVKIPIVSASAPLYESGYDASKLIDGNTATQWRTGSGKPLNASVTLDLGKEVEITGIRWMMADFSLAKEMTINIQSSLDGTRFVGPFTTFPYQGTWAGTTVSGTVRGRYIKLVFSNCDGAAPAGCQPTERIGGMAEVEVYGTTKTSAGANPAGTANLALDGTKIPLAGVNAAAAGGPATITKVVASVSQETVKTVTDGVSWSNWTIRAPSGGYAKINFSLSADVPLSGVRWKTWTPGFMDDVIVRVYNSQGQWRDLGRFGNADASADWIGAASTERIWYGVATTGSMTTNRVELIFANPNKDAYIGSLAEVEIWATTPTSSPSSPVGTLDPVFAGEPATITNAWDTPGTGSANRAYDGVSGSNWAAQGKPSYAKVMFDLGSDQTLTGVQWKMAYLGYADQFVVRLYSSAGSWMQLGSFTNPLAANRWFGAVVPDQFQARYVEFIFMNPNRDPAVGSVAEVEIWQLSTTAVGDLLINPTYAGAPAAIDRAIAEDRSSQVQIDQSGIGSIVDQDIHTSFTIPSGISAWTIGELLLDYQQITGVRWSFGSVQSTPEYYLVLRSGEDWTGESDYYIGPFGGQNPAPNGFVGVAVPPGLWVSYVRLEWASLGDPSPAFELAEIETWASTTPNSQMPNPLFSGSKIAATCGGACDNDLDTYVERNLLNYNNYRNTLNIELPGQFVVTGVKWIFTGTGQTQFVVRDAAHPDTLPLGVGTDVNQWYGISVPASRFPDDGTSQLSLNFLDPPGGHVNVRIQEVEVWGYPVGGTVNNASADPVFSGAPLPYVDSPAEPPVNVSASSVSPAQTVTYDLGRPSDLTGIRWPVGVDIPLTVATSDDGETWNDLGTYEPASDARVWQGMATPADTRARFVRVDYTPTGNDAITRQLDFLEIWGLNGPLAVASPVASPVASLVASPKASPEPLFTSPASITPEVIASPAPVTEEPSVSPSAIAVIDEPIATPVDMNEQPVEETVASLLPVEPTAILTATATAEPIEDTATFEPTAATEPTVAIEPTAAISTGIITNTDGDSVNCRTAPVDGDVITTVNEGDQVEVLGTAQDGWYPVTCDGLPGFISADFITLGNMPLADTPTETVTEPTSTAPSEGDATPTDVVTATVEPTLAPEETPYPISDAGDTENSGTAWLASDNDASTYWSVYPGISPEQTRLYFDLGSVVPIDRVTIELAWAGSLPVFEIWLSENGETWYNATPGGINGWDLGADEAHVVTLGYDARYVRLVIPNVEQSGLAEVGGVRQIDVWPGDINQTRYLTSLGDPTTPTPDPEPTEEAAPTAEPTGDLVPTSEAIEETVPTELIPTEEMAPPEDMPTEEVLPTEEMTQTEEPFTEPTAENDTGEQLPTEGDSGGGVQEGDPIVPNG